MTQNRAQIYKSDLRGCEESEVFRRLSTLNFGNYKDRSRNPFGSLLAFNEETLAARHNIFRHVEEDLEIILLPLLGGLVYKDNLDNQAIIGTEEIRVFSAQSGSNYQLINPYENELVCYLQIWIRAQKMTQSKSQHQIFEMSKNTLVPLFAPENSSESALQINTQAYGFIGIYDGRKGDTYALRNPKNGIFVFVINGAFEFENRLLESRDALSLEGIAVAEFEALSENAIVLILEVSIES